MSEYPPDSTGATDPDDAGRPDSPEGELPQDTDDADDTRGQYTEGDYGSAGRVAEAPRDGSEGEYADTEPEPESDAE